MAHYPNCEPLCRTTPWVISLWPPLGSQKCHSGSQMEKSILLSQQDMNFFFCALYFSSNGPKCHLVLCGISAVARVHFSAKFCSVLNSIHKHRPHEDRSNWMTSVSSLNRGFYRVSHSLAAIQINKQSILWYKYLIISSRHDGITFSEKLWVSTTWWLWWGKWTINAAFTVKNHIIIYVYVDFIK